jgi:uncharacterized repeat protein (TIGR01451 family)
MDNLRIRLRQVALLATAVLLAAGLLGGMLGALEAAETAVSAVDGAKTASRPAAHPGETLRYTIVISNGSVSPTLATMHDALPGALVYLSGTLAATDGRYAATGQTITWTGTLSPAEAVTVTFSAALSRQVRSGDLISNTAVISSSGAAVSRTAVVEVLPHILYLPLMQTQPPTLEMYPISPTCTVSNSWTVAWSDGGPYVDAYELQQAQTPDFAEPLAYTLTEAERLMQPPLSPDHLYHYRVRAIGHWGNGEWSNTRRVIGNFFDDFSDPESGWGTQESDLGRFRYEDGAYTILSKEAGYVFRRSAPSYLLDSYTVEADVRWDTAVTDGLYGIIFGLDQTAAEYYFFIVQPDTQEFRLIRRNANGTFFTLAPPTPSDAINVGGATNRLSAQRQGDEIILRVNGVLLGLWRDDGVTGLTGAGIAMSPNPANPVAEARFDNFTIHGCMIPAEDTQAANMNAMGAAAPTPPFADAAPNLWEATGGE